MTFRNAYSVPLIIFALFLLTPHALASECDTLVKNTVDSWRLEMANNPFFALMVPGYFDVPRIVLVSGPAGSGKTRNVTEVVLPKLNQMGKTSRYIDMTKDRNVEALQDTDIVAYDEAAATMEQSMDLPIERFLAGKSTIIILTSSAAGHASELLPALDHQLKNNLEQNSPQDAFAGMLAHEPILWIDLSASK